jgi:hypothetical protein
MAKEKPPVWLLLDSRVVDVLRLSNLILVTLSALKPLFFHGLKKALPFSDNVGAGCDRLCSKVSCRQRQLDHLERFARFDQRAIRV